MPKSTYLNNAVLNQVLRNSAFTSPAATYVALFSGNPTSGGSEVSGGSYARQAITFSVPSGGSTSSTNALNYSNMPSTTSNPISYVAIYDAASGGNMLYYSAAAAPKTTNSGDTISIAVGGIVVTET